MGAARRSRVTPGVGSTMAMRRPASQLNSEDLPTLGLPTMAICGTGTAILRAGCLGGAAGAHQEILYECRRPVSALAARRRHRAGSDNPLTGTVGAATVEPSTLERSWIVREAQEIVWPLPIPR